MNRLRSFLYSAATMAGALGWSAVATADINGFGDFSPVNWTINQDDTSSPPQIDIPAGRIKLTNDSLNIDEARSIFFNTPQTVTQFSASFIYQGPNVPGVGNGNGLVFVLQNSPAGPSAVSHTGFGFGGISPSAGVTFQVVSPPSRSGYFTGGVIGGGSEPTTPVDLFSGHEIAASITYNGTILQETLTDLTTNQTFSRSYVTNIPSAVGGSTAYVGFMASTGDFGFGVNQYISQFSFGPVPEPGALGGIVVAALGMLRRRRV